MGHKGFQEKIDYLQSIKTYCVGLIDNQSILS